jgi:hypothetical protein
MAECDGCGNKAATFLKAGFFKNEKNEREYFEYCNVCGQVGSVGVADVYWDGTPEHGLPDDPKTGEPHVFASRSEKARFLRENHLVEAGDRVHGSMIRHSRGNDETPQDSRQEVERALAHVRKMGRDVRRQEYLRIVKGSQKA